MDNNNRLLYERSSHPDSDRAAARVFSICTISQFANYCEFSLDDIQWRITDEGIRRHVSVIKKGALKPQEHLETDSKEALLARLVKFHLDHEGVKIKKLSIKNHPHGLEGCWPLRIDEFHWWCVIHSDRYDYTTWFDCIRHNQLAEAHIELVGDNLQLFSEPVIRGALSLTARTRVPLPTRAILDFNGLELMLSNQIATTEVLKKSFERWILESLQVGKMVEMKVDGRLKRDQLMKFVSEDLDVGLVDKSEEVDTCIFRLPEGSIQFMCSDSNITMEVIV